MAGVDQAGIAEVMQSVIMQFPCDVQNEMAQVVHLISPCQLHNIDFHCAECVSGRRQCHAARLQGHIIEYKYSLIVTDLIGSH